MAGHKAPVRAAWAPPQGMKARMQVLGSTVPGSVVLRPARSTARPRMAAPTTAWQAPATTAMAAGVTTIRT